MIAAVMIPDFWAGFVLGLVVMLLTMVALAQWAKRD